MNTIKTKLAILILITIILIPFAVQAMHTIGSPYPQFPFQKNLSYNICDNDVQTLQNYLVSHNFLPTGTVVTGDFDAATVKGVKKFQVSVGLKGDGIVGPQTRAILNKENGKQKPIILEPGQMATGLIPTAKCIYDKIPVAQIPSN